MRFIHCLLILLIAPALSAQIAAPDFSCTRSEAGAVVLNWVNVAESCGPYEATEIYSATDLAGPFTLLAEVNDATATSYSDPNPAGQLRYYYLSYRYNCPGQTALNSDTLDNFIPVAPVIQYVGIEGNEIVIDWLPSVSPEVTGYVVLEVTSTSFIPIDTVNTVTEYRLPFTPSDPNAANRQFLVVALDPCNNDSPQSSIVSAMSLSGMNGTGCTRDLLLSIDRASLGGFLPATSLELFVSVNGSPFTSAGTSPPTAETIAYRDANDGENLCFYVEAVLTNNAGRARSEVFCQMIAINQPVVDFALYGVEIDAAGNLSFQYEDNLLQPVATDEQLVITRTGGVLEFAPLANFSTGALNPFILPPLAQPLQPDETFRFRLTDDCGREVTTNAVEPVYLTVRGLIPGQNQLSWTALFNGLDGETSYDVFLVDAGTTLVPLVSNLTDLGFAHVVDGNASGEICYIVRANFRPEGAATTESFFFNSNTACVVPKPELYLPNAFSPNGDGVNDVFRPFFSSPPQAEGFLLQVWDRWGSLVHETTDFQEGWDGTKELQILPSGVYVYVLQYTAGEDDQRQRSGTVNMLK